MALITDTPFPNKNTTKNVFANLYNSTWEFLADLCWQLISISKFICYNMRHCTFFINLLKVTANALKIKIMIFITMHCIYELYLFLRPKFRYFTKLLFTDIFFINCIEFTHCIRIVNFFSWNIFELFLTKLLQIKKHYKESYYYFFIAKKFTKFKNIFDLH